MHSFRHVAKRDSPDLFHLHCLGAPPASSFPNGPIWEELGTVSLRSLSQDGPAVPAMRRRRGAIPHSPEDSSEMDLLELPWLWEAPRRSDPLPIRLEESIPSVRRAPFGQSQVPPTCFPLGAPRSLPVQRRFQGSRWFLRGFVEIGNDRNHLLEAREQSPHPADYAEGRANTSLPQWRPNNWGIHYLFPSPQPPVADPTGVRATVFRTQSQRRT